MKERYSFSKLSSFNNCRHAFNLRYNERQEGVGNCFSSYGLLIHKIMERYAKGELLLWDLADVFKDEFDESVPENFPSSQYCPDMRKLYYEQGLEYLSNFAGYQNIRILEIETEFDLDLADWTFTGVIDLVFEDEAGRLIIADYKSKSSFKNKEEQSEYARQLYLYSLYVHNKYGRYPDALQFVLVRKNKVIEIPFGVEALHEATIWANSVVCDIRTCFDFTPSPNHFFCNHLCNFREKCEYKAAPEIKKKARYQKR